MYRYSQNLTVFKPKQIKMAYVQIVGKNNKIVFKTILTSRRTEGGQGFISYNVEVLNNYMGIAPFPLP